LQFIIEAAASRYLQLARDRHGCCVLQKCIEHSNDEQRNDLLSKITSSALRLSEDQYGYVRSFSILILFLSNLNDILLLLCLLHNARYNFGSGRNYVIQFILGLKIQWATARVVDELAGHVGNLSMQKCGSHVVEHCLSQSPQLMCDRIINELMNDPKLPQIIIDQYGNFVIQTALKQCQVKIQLHPQPKEFHVQSLPKRLFNVAG